MLKKILAVSFIVLLLGTLLASYFYFQKQEEYRGADALKAVPVDAEFIITIDNLEQLVEQFRDSSGALQELQNIDEIKEIARNLNKIDSLVNGAGNADAEVALNRSVTIATHLQGRNDIKFLYILPIIDYLDEKNIISVIEKMITPDKFKVRNYQNTDIYTAKTFHFAIVKGMFVASRSKILLENAIRQVISGKSIAANKGFHQIRKTVGSGADANMFINLKLFPRLLSFIAGKNYKKAIKKGANLATWAALDLTMRDNVILLNGFSYSDIKERNYLTVFLKQNAVELQMESVIPADAAVVSAFGFSNVESYKEKYQKYLSQMGSLEIYRANIGAMKRKLGTDMEKLMYNVLFNEIGLVYSGNSSDKPFTIIRTKSASIAKEGMIKAIKYYAKKRKQGLGNYHRVYQLDAATKFDIYRFPEEKLPSKLFGMWFNNASSKYFTFIDNYMVMNEDKRLLSEYLKSVALGKTIDTNKNYEESKEYLSKEANFLFYASTLRCHKLFKQFMDKEMQQKLEDYQSCLTKFQTLGLQLSSTNQLIYNNLFITYNPVVEIAPQTVWESKLDTCFRHKPFLVKNHRNKETEIFVQDEKNNIYLISNSGTILWKRPIDEKIIGDVEQIDCFRNNKLQYLFTTSKHLYLVDRNGNDVKSYPIRLPAKATRGVAVFDYDNNRNYRIFVACNDKKVYAYSREGRKITGWKSKRADNPIACDVQFFRVKGKDYLVYADQFRTYILNRRGEERVKLKKQFSKSTNNPFYLDKRTNKLISTDINGTIFEIDLKGNVQSKPILKLSANHYFNIADLDADGRNEYIFADSNFIKVFSNKGKLLWSKKFDAAVSYAPNIYRFSRRAVEIGICVADENKIYLLDAKGKAHAGFPLKGNTKFSIGFTKKDNKGFHLFVGNNRNFLLNYDVQ